MIKRLWSYFRRKHERQEGWEKAREQETNRLKDAVDKFEQAVKQRQRGLVNGVDKQSHH